MLFPMSEEKML